jgi:hypothetical protein
LLRRVLNKKFLRRVNNKKFLKRLLNRKFLNKKPLKVLIRSPNKLSSCWNLN